MRLDVFINKMRKLPWLIVTKISGHVSPPCGDKRSVTVVPDVVNVQALLSIFDMNASTNNYW